MNDQSFKIVQHERSIVQDRSKTQKKLAVDKKRGWKRAQSVAMGSMKRQRGLLGVGKTSTRHVSGPIPTPTGGTLFVGVEAVQEGQVRAIHIFDIS